MDKVILFGAGAEQGYNLALGSKNSPIKSTHSPIKIPYYLI